jgi:outer membrane protein OmpA-like peptidoglycan-associated protein
MKTTRIGLIFLFVGLALTGCQSVTPHAPEGAAATGQVIVLERGIDQLRDEDSGEHYYVVCDACARPTLKTRYRPLVPLAMSRLEPAPAAQAVVVKEPPSEAPTAVQETPIKRQAAAYKRLVPFGFGRDKLGPLGRQAMVALLEKAKAAELIHVRGYTDILGRMPSNKRLAMARAEAIRAYLVQGGVTPEKISVSHCIDCFIESNESNEGRAANRRAVVVMRPSVDAVDDIDLDRRDACRSRVVMASLT